MTSDNKIIETIKPVTDLSPKVVRLARAIDRLPPGTHYIMLDKPLDGGSWTIRIDKSEIERTMEI